MSSVLLLAASVSSCVYVPEARDASAGDLPSQATCVDRPELLAAVDTLWAASTGDASIKVFGEEGGRRNNLFDLMNRSDVAAMENPKGTGRIVSVVYAGGPASMTETAKRTGWLVLGSSLYPIDPTAAAAFGLRLDGFPDVVRQAAGLDDKALGMEGFGLDDFVSYNSDNSEDYGVFIVSANDLCESPSVWG